MYKPETHQFCHLPIGGPNTTVSSTAPYRKLKTACCWLHSVISHSVALKRGGNNHHHPKVQAANQNNDLKAKEWSIQCTCTHYHVINQQNRPFEQSVRNCWSTPTHPPLPSLQEPPLWNWRRVGYRKSERRVSTQSCHQKTSASATESPQGFIGDPGLQDRPPKISQSK